MQLQVIHIRIHLNKVTKENEKEITVKLSKKSTQVDFISCSCSFFKNKNYLTSLVTNTNYRRTTSFPICRFLSTCCGSAYFDGIRVAT